MGVQDPDPTVAGKGIQRLQEAGIDVQMFDHELQDIILAENERFFAEALERAKASAEERPDSIELSRLERTILAAKSTDLDAALLESYRAAFGIEARVDSDEFWRHLALSGSAARVGETWKPTGYGMVLFGKAPRLAVPEAGLIAELRYPDGRVETKDFDQALLKIPDRAIEWLKGKCHRRFAFHQFQSRLLGAFGGSEHNTLRCLRRWFRHWLRCLFYGFLRF